MTQLEIFRKEIDEINIKLIELFKKRMEISKKIGDFKKENDIPILDLNREKEIIKTYTENEDSRYKEYIKKFLQNIMDISKEAQN
ncbi:MAG: chorismate mutase [Fusobacterium sp.]|nr:chorismate mutase [Fusobacterium sp.]